MYVRLLGPVLAGEDPETMREVPGVVAQVVLAALALAHGRLVTFDQLADAVWDERPASWRNALHVAISKLRDALGRQGVMTAPGGYRLDGALARVDLLEVSELLTDARRLADLPQWPEALAACEAILATAVAPALPGAQSRWAADLQNTAAEQVNEARFIRAQSLTALARLPEAIAELTALTQVRPLDESVSAALIRALAAGGRAAEALATYDALRRRLADELGVDPQPQTQAAFLEVLNPGPPRPFTPVRMVQLPSLPGPTFGRELVLDAIDRAFAGGYPLVTIVGAGGMGKTRVAIAAARRLADARPCSAWFVDLTAIPDATDLEGVLNASIDPNRADYRVALAEGSHLVVLDNAEHLIPAIAELAETLLGYGDVVVLVSSRVALRSASERVVWLPELPHDGADSPAVQLLRDRAEHWLSLTPSDDLVIAELANRADGVPLALELLAAALRWQTPLELLDDIADALRTPHPDGVRAERHVSVTAAIEWNLAQASPAARRALGALLVPLGDFPLAVAEAMLAADQPGPTARQLLTELVDLSLVQRVAGAGSVRLRVLEPVRCAVSAEASVPPATVVSQTASAHYFVDLVRAAVDALDSSDEELLRLHRLDDHNIGPAIQWLLQQEPGRAVAGLGHVMYYWRVITRTDLIESWAARMGDDPGCTTSDWARCAIAIAESFTMRSLPEATTGLLPLVQQHVAELDHRWQFLWMITLAELRRLDGDFAGARALLDAGPTPRTRREESLLACTLAVVAAFSGDTEAAAAVIDEILDRGLVDDQLSQRVLHLGNRSYLAITSGDLDRAEGLLTEAVALSRASGLRDDFLMANNNTAWLLLARHRPAEAVATIRASVESLVRVDDLHWSVEIPLISALALEAGGQVESCDRVVGLLRAQLSDAPPALLDPWAREQAEGVLGRWPPHAQPPVMCIEVLADELRLAGEALAAATQRPA